MFGFVGGDISYSSSYNSMVGMQDHSVVDSYTLLSLRAGISDADDVWHVTGWMRNATNEDYYSSVSFGNDTVNHIMGKERRMGVTFQYNWE